MAAPTPTTRSTPGGIPLRDGYQSLITLACDPDICFWERSVTPPAMDGGEPISRTNMHNTNFRTKGPGSLIDTGDISIECMYDPNIYGVAQASINVETTITVEFGDGSTVAFYGYLRTLTPGALEIGSEPTMTVVLVCTNWDPVNHVEAGPAISSVAGT